MSSVRVSSTNTENFFNNSQQSSDRWTIATEHKISKHKHGPDFDHNIRKTNFKLTNECLVNERIAENGVGKYGAGKGGISRPKKRNSKINDEKQLVNDRKDDLSLDFSWLTKDFQVQCANDSSTRGVKFDPFENGPEQSLSQRSSFQSTNLKLSTSESNWKDERRCIEEEIRQKYAEINVMLKQMHSKRRKRRKKMQLKNNDVAEEIQINQWDHPKSNICPIKRQKRSAQPIRNALLVRTAMRKAWKGILGSCCGKGCWATWKWVNLRGVMSDYE
ncbi:hypothetical protein ACF0H5_001621 [Mactra antiquata]